MSISSRRRRASSRSHIFIVHRHPVNAVLAILLLCGAAAFEGQQASARYGALLCREKGYTPGCAHDGAPPPAGPPTPAGPPSPGGMSSYTVWMLSPVSRRAPPWAPPPPPPTTVCVGSLPPLRTPLGATPLAPALGAATAGSTTVAPSRSSSTSASRSCSGCAPILGQVRILGSSHLSAATKAGVRLFAPT